MKSRSPFGFRYSIRIKGRDYTQAACYFVTLCTKNRARVLSSVSAGRVKHSPVGDIVRQVWESIPARFVLVRLRTVAIMPDHMQ